jgi:L-threonylcarbamoyladenylate synthase
MIRIVSPDQAAINAAAQLLEQGKLVAFPTETVYGLGADAENPAAVAAIYSAKGRPSTHPVMVQLSLHADIHRWVEELSPAAEKLMQTFWPGPLTLILKRAPHIPAAVSGGQDTIGLRCPSHPVALALLAAFKQGQGGIAAPSANRFGHVSPTSAQHVVDEFSEIKPEPIACLLDGGQSDVGIESTILDMSRMESTGPVLLRPGQITSEQIAAVIGMLPASPDQAAPRVSGALDAHYAPRTPLVLVDTSELYGVMNALKSHHRKIALLSCVSAEIKQTENILAVKNLPSEADRYAHGLYASLRELDMAGADVILLESPPKNLAWQGIQDRLGRAAFDSLGVLHRLCSGAV